MVVTVAIFGLMLMFLDLAVLAYAFNLAENKGRGSYDFASSPRFPRHTEIMRWIVRDFGVFLYGCVFACKYIVLGETHVSLASGANTVLG